MLYPAQGPSAPARLCLNHREQVTIWTPTPPAQLSPWLSRHLEWHIIYLKLFMTRARSLKEYKSYYYLRCTSWLFTLAARCRYTSLWSTSCSMHCFPRIKWGKLQTTRQHNSTQRHGCSNRAVLNQTGEREGQKEGNRLNTDSSWAEKIQTYVLIHKIIAAPFITMSSNSEGTDDSFSAAFHLKHPLFLPELIHCSKKWKSVWV